MQDGSVTLQGVCLLQAIGAFLPPAWAAIVAAAWVAGVHVFLYIDLILSARAGLRFELRFWRYVTDIRLFVPHWRRHVAWLLSAAAATFAALLWYFSRLAPSTAETSCATWMVCAAVAIVLSAAARRQAAQLQPRIMIAWTHRLLMLQWAAQHAISFARQKTEQQAGVRDFLSVDATDPTYPWWREGKAATGPTVFNFVSADKTPPHVVFLFLESFRAADISVLGSPLQLTPEFDALAESGVLWRRFYSNAANTSGAALASIYGVLPPGDPDPVQLWPKPPPLFGLPQALAAHGYASHAFKGADGAFENNGPFFLQNGFAGMHDRQHIFAQYPNAEKSIWGMHDEYLLRYHASWLQEQDARGQPTFSAIFTVSNHHPWQAPADFVDPRVPAPGSDYDNYRRTLRYTDHCLGLYTRLLTTLQLAPKTLLFVMADTGAQQETPDGAMQLAAYVRDAGMHIPLLLWAPSRLPEPNVVDDVCSQVDLLPTVLDLLDKQTPHHAMGTSLRRVPAHARPPVALLNAQQPGYTSLRWDTWKFSICELFDSVLLYDLATDVHEQHNVARQHPEIVRQRLPQARALRPFIARLYRQHRWVPPEHVTANPVAQATVAAAPQFGSLEDAQACRDRLQTDRATLGRRDAHMLRMLTGYLGSHLSPEDQVLAINLRAKILHHIDGRQSLTAQEAVDHKRIEAMLEAEQQRVLAAVLKKPPS